MNWLSGVATAVSLSIVALITAAVVSFLTAIPTYYLWNWLMPEIFHFITISYVQAWGICFLAGLLFKGSSFSSNRSPDDRFVTFNARFF